MKILTFDINGDYGEVISEAINVLEKGGTVVYPTDTFYCLGANACDINSVDSVFKIKKYPFSKPLPIIARDMKWVRELVFVLPKLEKILSEIWPGSTTVILPRQSVVPAIVTAGSPDIGLRVPNYALTDKLLSRFGYPLTAVSAGESDGAEAGDIGRIIQSFRSQVWKPDLILDVGTLPVAQPSAILDLSKVRPKILRIGSSNPEQLMKILGIR